MVGKLERVTTAPGAGGMLPAPHREPNMDESSLPADHQAIMRILAAASGPIPANDVSAELGRGTQPGQVEPVRDKHRRQRTGAPEMARTFHDRPARPQYQERPWLTPFLKDSRRT
ncbi:hypothetical protein [Streptomyces sp. NPDC046712]|uniref:hypothetical protein n=1 Tax=Streptomyces sp. NPDC046712 TaxID=3154802 RepID=UPI0033D26C2C